MSSIVVDKTGTVKMIYEDDLRGLLVAGDATIKRVSHVEPTIDGRWTADLSPVQGPLLGPFDTRKQALDEEINWINTNVL